MYVRPPVLIISNACPTYGIIAIDSMVEGVVGSRQGVTV